MQTSVSLELDKEKYKEKLFYKTLEYILRSPKTERQVRDWLFKKRSEGEFLPVEDIISRLKELGYINDTEYAQTFVQVKQTKIGVKSIRQKLVSKGINRELASSVILEISDQTELAKTLANKYMRNKTYDQKNLQKLYRFLLNKGFNYDTINSIMVSLREPLES